MAQNFPALRAGISPETELKAQIFPALRAGALQMVQKGPHTRFTTRFPHTYSICLYSPVLQAGRVRGGQSYQKNGRT